MHTSSILKLALPALALAACTSTPDTKVCSPDGDIAVEFGTDAAGTPRYSVVYKTDTIVRPSALGFDLLGSGSDLADGFTVDGVEHSSHEGSWTPVWGENDSIADNYNAMTVRMTQKGTGVKMNVEFRVYDDGAAFRYVFPAQEGTDSLMIAEELTEFAMAGDHTAWWIPGDYDTQEYEYTESRLSAIRDKNSSDQPGNVSATGFSPTGVQTSLLMRDDSGTYINIHEAALIDYPAMHLDLNDTTMVFRSHLTPGIPEAKATVALPFATPWRVVMIGSATDILATDIIYNLNEPCALEDVSWIHPTKYMGVWWEMITGKTQWSYTNAENFDLATFDYSKAKPHGHHGANNANVRRYIDFAADNGFDQLLVEGWNIGWEDWFGKEKDYVFDFVTPYPDFDLKALNDYAHSRGIKLMMHHETSGSPANYEAHMDTAYALMNAYGYDAVKSGYVGNILPKGDTHYSQRMVRHYLDAVKRAADRHIMVNGHEAVRPTGLARTYPNMVGNESAMGTEYRNMSTQHVTILPFTRLKGGPMDFTPGVFRMDIGSFVPGSNEHKKATVANQLALYVTMYSPLQMAADMPEHYAEKADAFQFIKDVPVDWSESRYLDAEPGRFIIAARREKGGQDWYVGGVNADGQRTATVDFSFLTPGKAYEATVYADAENADAYTNPEAYRIYTQKVTSESTLSIPMASGGGFAIAVKQIP
ncbi:MAG: glycoside hydrolase family 97 protein [Muribaculaceae bacterium]|nr:glycoside hydrolase family 97 protein [Muribaculaceae bacterium]